MPCYLTGSREGDLELELRVLQTEATAATRAACDMAKAIGRGSVWPKLLLSTQNWIRKHEEIDRERRSQKPKKSRNRFIKP